MPIELSDNLRQRVIDRAGNRCEYCLLPQAADFHRHEPDHIVVASMEEKQMRAILRWLVCAVTGTRDQMLAQLTH